MMPTRPKEKQHVHMVIRNLQPNYHQHLWFQPLDTFIQLHVAEILVKKDIRKSLKNSYEGNKISFTDKKVDTTSNVKAINEVNVVESSRPRYPYRVFALLGM